jgi:hypothetical protein
MNIKIDEFVAGLSEAVDLPGVEIGADMPLRALPAWDSLCMLKVIAYVDEVSGVVLAARQIRAETTPIDLWNIVFGDA